MLSKFLFGSVQDLIISLGDINKKEYKMDLSLENIASLIKLLSDNKLDSLELGELKLKKSLYESKDDPFIAPKQMTNEELMFAAGASDLPEELKQAFLRPRRRQSQE
jgi:hypothetical protein